MPWQKAVSIDHFGRLGRGRRRAKFIKQGSITKLVDHVIALQYDSTFEASLFDNTIVGFKFRTLLNNEPEETLRLWNRPADLSFVLTRLLADPFWGQRIDANRIGVAGHSSGGYTAFALAGAIYDADVMAAYCESDRRGPDCELVKGVDFGKVDFSAASESYRDRRIRASLAMAPAAGNGIRSSSLAAIAIPVHVVTTEYDAILDPARNAIHYAKQTPGSTMSVEREGGHFVYLSRCSLVTAVFTYFLEFDICGTRSSVDRDAVHRRISGQAVAFFDEKLGM